MTRTEYQRLEKAIRTEKSQPIIRQMYRPGTIARSIADKQWHDDILRTKSNALAAGCQLKNWYQAFTPGR